jgi:hypothetical protein
MADVQQPSVNRAVHYVAYGTPGGEFPAGVCRAAIITEVNPAPNPGGLVGVCVLNPTGLFFNRNVPFDETNKPGSWHWPERV